MGLWQGCVQTLFRFGQVLSDYRRNLSRFRRSRPTICYAARYRSRF